MQQHQDFREEHDSMGSVRVPADRYWGAQTERARLRFAIGDEAMPLEIIHAIALIKKAAALANRELGVLGDGPCDLIVRVVDELLQGQHDGHFPLHVWQSGSGTQTNMNVNEVIANRACEMAGAALGSKDPVHPNDHVNRSQSTNDVFPSALHLAAGTLVRQRLLPELGQLCDALERKAQAWRGLVKIGRTHLQDAVPLSLGQEVGGWAAQLRSAAARLHHALAEVRCIPLGGTAVGTGLNSPAGYGRQAAAHLSRWTGVDWSVSGNRFALMASHDGLVTLMDQQRLLAAALHRIVNDMRLLGSGPRAGLGELRLPGNEPGSSIMPGKVNPTQCEAVAMATLQLMGDAAVTAMAGAAGQLQMNVYKPLMGFNLIRAGRLLTDCCRSLRQHLVEGLEVDRERLRELCDRSLMLVTALAPEIGYDRAAAIAHHAHAQQLSLRQAALALGAIDADRFDRLVDAQAMAHPHGGST
ncbi:MAG: class II fumarate hydratase [Aphanocapsa feldmannii 277cV]|uniref:Fumarate hydratase class II n=2 Tax=Aphanocapsa feldmannii TaxID=192050 RepID=A0A524RPP9_9CHRO|nr:MAG: class II fumarate hydratase [Aphanocapsa feldmannii 277cV]TGH20880.1 MAG: class II fumarate hydratase [Aphanocapsa feldmannii 277cI]